MNLIASPRYKPRPEQLPCIIAKSYNDVLTMLKSYQYKTLYLAHDLAGTEPRQNGYSILMWLECNLHYLPQRIEIIEIDKILAGTKIKMEILVKNLFIMQESER